MNDQPDFILPSFAIGGTQVWHYLIAFHANRRDVLRLRPDMTVELGDGVTLRDALVHLVSIACSGTASNLLCGAIADEIIRLAREDRDE